MAQGSTHVEPGNGAMVRAAGEVWIALDAMGSDHGPSMTVAGALNGISVHGVNVILVGDAQVLNAEIVKQGGRELLGRRLRVEHASEVAQMDDKPGVAVRKKNTSMRVAYDLVKKGTAAAVVSAGNSGAYMGTALLVLGRLKGVLRPAIGTLFPSPRSLNATLLLDAGANTVVAPEYLVQWAFMGDAYARVIQHKTSPKVCVLSNGEEDSKGTDLTRAANADLRRAGNMLHYAGYCEGRDVSTGEIDVVITDGFTGNVVLKTLEGTGRAIKEGLEARFRKNIFSKLQYLVVSNIFRELRNATDYRLKGGAPLLGINGVAIVAHGKSDAVALGHALRVAQTHVDLKLNQALAAAVQRHLDVFPDAKERARTQLQGASASP